MHRRQFVCSDCDAKFDDKQSMPQHLTTAHGESSFAKAQLPFILNLCNRHVEETSTQVCILCGEEMSLIALQGHLAAHMEDLALFVLPLNAIDEQDADSNVSNRVIGDKSPVLEDQNSNFSSLAFSDSSGPELSGTNEGPSQTRWSIDQLKNDKSLAYSQKIGTWMGKDRLESENQTGPSQALWTIGQLNREEDSTYSHKIRAQIGKDKHESEDHTGPRQTLWSIEQMKKEKGLTYSQKIETWFGKGRHESGNKPGPSNDTPTAESHSDSGSSTKAWSVEAQHEDAQIKYARPDYN